VEVLPVEEDSRLAAGEGTPSEVQVVQEDKLVQEDRVLEDRAVVVGQDKVVEVDRAPENLLRRKQEVAVPSFPCCNSDADTRVITRL